MTAHIWNIGVVQNQQFPNRVTLMTNTGLNMFYIIVTNLGGATVKVFRGADLQITLPPNQSGGFASDTDVHLEIEEGPRRGALGNFSIMTY